MDKYEIIMALLDPNIYSRPQSKMMGIRGICLHYVGNPTSKAINNRNYFNNLPAQNRRTIEEAKAQGKKPVLRYASSHEIIGLQGEVVICLPKDEVAFHAGGKSYKSRVKSLLSGSPNRYLYGIEVCHPDWGGKFSDITYKTVINRSADLLIDFGLKPSKDTIWRHWDVTGKDCPNYYTGETNKAWDQLVADITKRYNEKINHKVEEAISMALENWQKELGEKAVNNLANKKVRGVQVVNSPSDWDKTLGDNVPQWLFWTIIDRITN